ncbi:hypothetical protein IWQ51_006774 [Labrenzia sp. EL_142]|nr:hypothetical protein [Labrenzia sp. EL_142]
MSGQTLSDEREVSLAELPTPERDRDMLQPILSAELEKKAALDADARFIDLKDRITEAETGTTTATEAHEAAKQALAERQLEQSTARTQVETILRKVPDAFRDTGCLENELERAIIERDGLVRAHHVALDADKEAAVAFAAAVEGLNGAKTALRRTKTALEKAK